MENLKEYLPILLIALAVLLSFAKKSKRKVEEKKESQPPGLPEKVIFVDEGLRKKHDGDIRVVSEKVKEKVKVKEKEKEEISILEEEIIVHKPFLNLEDKDELKRAVILSEIIQRKTSF